MIIIFLAMLLFMCVSAAVGKTWRPHRNWWRWRRNSIWRCKKCRERGGLQKREDESTMQRLALSTIDKKAERWHHICHLWLRLPAHPSNKWVKRFPLCRVPICNPLNCKLRRNYDLSQATCLQRTKKRKRRSRFSWVTYRIWNLTTVMTLCYLPTSFRLASVTFTRDAARGLHTTMATSPSLSLKKVGCL